MDQPNVHPTTGGKARSGKRARVASGVQAASTASVATVSGAPSKRTAGLVTSGTGHLSRSSSGGNSAANTGGVLPQHIKALATPVVLPLGREVRAQKFPPRALLTSRGIVAFPYKYLGLDDNTGEALLVMRKQLVNYGSAGMGAPMVWANGWGFSTGWEHILNGSTHAGGFVDITHTHNSVHPNGWHVDWEMCFAVKRSDLHDVVLHGSMLLPFVHAEHASHVRSLLPPWSPSVHKKWFGYNQECWPIRPHPNDDGRIKDTLYQTIQLHGPLELGDVPYGLCPAKFTRASIMSHLIVDFGLSGEEPFGTLRFTPAYWHRYVVPSEERGPLGHHRREALIGQHGLFYAGEQPIPPGKVLMAYSGYVSHDDTRAVIAGDRRGTTFDLAWNGMYVVPDAENMAQYANDVALNLYAPSGRNHVAALQVNAIFIKVIIFGVPVPVYMSVAQINPGDQLAVDYGKNYKPGLVG